MECPLVARDLALLVTSVYEVRYTIDRLDNQQSNTTIRLHKLAVNTSPTDLTVQSLVFAVAIPREDLEVFRQVRGSHMFAACHIGHLHAVGANTMD